MDSQVQVPPNEHYLSAMLQEKMLRTIVLEMDGWMDGWVMDGWMDGWMGDYKVIIMRNQNADYMDSNSDSDTYCFCDWENLHKPQFYHL